MTVIKLFLIGLIVSSVGFIIPNTIMQFILTFIGGFLTGISVLEVIENGL